MGESINFSSPAVAELQGLYGAFSFAEKLLQKIWWRGDFDRTAARATDGRRVRLVHAGKWNLLGGPDFTGARLRLGDDASPEIHGDVEVHLHAEDWNVHDHARDPSYDRVVLHVVLFPPGEGRVTRGVGGREIPTLVLLPLLHRGLEEFAADEAVESLARRPLARLPAELGTLPVAELDGLLRRQALKRWRQKVHFSRIRVERLGWAEACHHAALEILGYRFNRAPMLRIAGRWPLAGWADGAVDPDEVFAAESEAWSVQGVRPANQPRARLLQYAAWARARPDWPDRLLALSEAMAVADLAGETREWRRRHGCVALRTRVSDEVCGGVLGGTRLDNVICDGMLPIMAAHRGVEAAGIWYHWYAGDLPAWLRSGLRQLGYFDARNLPVCHGAAQGVLGWFLEREPTR